jgi:hypothetical protein
MVEAGDQKQRTQTNERDGRSGFANKLLGEQFLSVDAIVGGIRNTA